MGNSPEALENDHIILKVERKPNCIMSLDIMTKPLASQAAKEKALRNISKEASLPGFRKGKAPADLILKQFKPQYDKEVKDIILRSALNEALSLSKLRPFSEKSPVNLIKSEPQDDSHYHIVIEFEAYPEIPSIDLASLKIESVQPEIVDDKIVEEKIEDLRLYHAAWQEILDRPAGENDFVTVDIDVVDEKPFPVYRDRRFQLKDKKIPDWAKQLIIGLKPGESKEGYSEKEEGSSEKFSPRKCKITVKKIEVPLLPNVDEDFAKKAGVNTVDELKKAIVTSLERDNAREAQTKMRLAMKKLLTDKYVFDLPSSRLESIKEDCKEMALGETERFKTEEDLKSYEEELLRDNISSLKLSFLLPRLIHEQKIPMPDTQRLQERVINYMFSSQKNMQNISEEELQYLARLAENELITEDALDFLIAKATA